MRIIFNKRGVGDTTLWAFHDDGTSEYFNGVSEDLYQKGQRGDLSMYQVYKIMSEVCVGLTEEDCGIAQITAAQVLMQEHIDLMNQLSASGEDIPSWVVHEIDQCMDMKYKNAHGSLDVELTLEEEETDDDK